MRCYSSIVITLRILAQGFIHLQYARLDATIVSGDVNDVGSNKIVILTNKIYQNLEIT